jgi:hypothetical protein
MIQFYDSKNITILRLPNPQSNNNKVANKRQLIRYVNKNQVIKSSFEVCRYKLGYRIIIPMVNQNGNHYGVVEYGVNLLYFVDEIFKENSSVKAEILVKSENLKTLKHQQEYETYNEYSIISTTPLFKQLRSQIDFEKKYQLITHADKTYMLINSLNFDDLLVIR